MSVRWVSSERGVPPAAYHPLRLDVRHIPGVDGAFIQQETMMAKGDSAGEGVYRITEVIGSSTKSWEDATANAVATASKTLRDLRIAEVSKLDVKVENGKVAAYRARILLSFKYEG